MRDVTQITEASADCFKDEIAIDFPSVDGLVDRARDAFLGPDAEADSQTLTREVRLSNNEARRGAIVTIDLPLKGTCSRCGGRGESWTEPCHVCCGSGERLVRHPVRVSVPPGVANGTRFRFRVTAPQSLSVRVELRVAIGA